MSEEIVACSGCGKKFRIPEGSPSTGKFACTACGADVAWGGSAGGGGGGKRGSGAKRSTAKRGKSSGASRGARRARGRKTRDAAPAADGDESDRRGRQAPAKKENKTLPIVVAIMGVVLLAGGLIIAFTGEKLDYAAEAEAEAAAAAANRNTGAVGGLSSSDTPEPVAEPPEPPPVEDGADATDPDAADDPQPAEDSGIGGARTGAEDGKGYRYWYLRPDGEIFITIDPVQGTTDEEAAELERLAKLATDFDAGSAGMNAERDLHKTGRKAVPFLLSQFQVAFNGSKWTELNDKFAAGKIQQLCRLICKKDGPPSDFVARFDPQGGVPPEHYERAGRMWIAWWMGEGRYIEEFEAYEDEE
jgi:hypothetical protein